MSDTAYYCPAPFWTLRESGWIKSLLLFFDHIATLLPDYMYGRHVAGDPLLTAPLEERGLLRVLEPKDWVDQETAARLADIIVEMLTNGTFDDLPETEFFAELSQIATVRAPRLAPPPDSALLLERNPFVFPHHRSHVSQVSLDPPPPNPAQQKRMLAPVPV